MSARAAATEATRERIVDSAFDLFMERWYDEVTMRGVAAAAGVALQTVVNHFGSKEELFSAVIERFQEKIDEARDKVARGDVAAAARALAQDYELTGDPTVRLLALEHRVDFVRLALAEGRRQHRAWVERTLPGALGRLRGASRERRMALLMAATDVLTWKLLRRDQGLSQAKTEAALRELLQGLHPHPEGGTP